MAELRELTDLEIDALREVASIGAGHAATALSQMIERTVMISVPTVRIVPLEEAGQLVGRPDDIIAAVLMHMMGDLTGRTLLVFPERAAKQLCDILLRRPGGSTLTFAVMEQSGLKEVGNILSSAYFNALSDFMGMMLMPSIPSLVIDYSAAVLTSTTLDFGHERDAVLCVETDLRVRDSEDKVTGHFILMPDVPSLRAIFDAVRLA